MKIQEQDLFHGAALTQIIEHAAFTAINRLEYGLYALNHDRVVLVKHTAKETTEFRFTVTPAEFRTSGSCFAFRFDVVPRATCDLGLT